MSSPCFQIMLKCYHISLELILRNAEYLSDESIVVHLGSENGGCRNVGQKKNSIFSCTEKVREAT